MLRCHLPWVMLAAVGCTLDAGPPPKPGTQIGALRPEPPVDYQLIDVKAAVEAALTLGGTATAAAPWRANAGAMDEGLQACPQWWAGMPPDDLVTIVSDLDEAAGFSWTAQCATDPGAVTFSGFSWFTSAVGATTASRDLVVDATVTDAAGNVLFDYDGEASDALDWTGGTAYESAFSGEITGSLAGVGSGLRASNNAGDDASGGFVASWRSDGSMAFGGALEVFDGFGPPDTRDPAQAPELEGVTGWVPGLPRFTSVRFDVEFREDCAAEPYGYVGLRGNEGFWFDVYFLPKYTPDDDDDGDGVPDGESALTNAFPYEQIDNVACDGVGTLFARNVDLELLDEADPSWSREIAPDFAAVAGTLPTPAVDDYVLTLRHLPGN